MAPTTIVTVQTPADTIDLTVLATIQDDWSIPSTADTAFLSRTITRCSAAAAAFCNRVFGAETVLEEIWPARDAFPYQVPGGLFPLQLSRWPLVSVATVVVGVGTLAQTLTAGTDYRLVPNAGQLVKLDINGQPQTWPPDYIAVTYTGGYALPGDTSPPTGAPPLPMDIQDAVSRMVWSRYAERQRDPFIRSETVQGVGSVQYLTPAGDANMSPDVADILEKYRVPVVG